MIDVKYNRKKHTLTVKGHAASGEQGHDLVCAAASMLVYTLAADISNASDCKSIRRPVLKLDPGDAKISCDPVHGMDSVTALIFDSVCVGFDVLAQKYPDNVAYTMI